MAGRLRSKGQKTAKGGKAQPATPDVCFCRK
jgi:hypothetical protein